MKPTAPDDPWQRFAAAARHSQHMTAPPGNGQAPAGLVARVVARAMQARREFLELLWQRWSWRVPHSALRGDALSHIGVAAAGCGAGTSQAQAEHQAVGLVGQLLICEAGG